MLDPQATGSEATRFRNAACARTHTHTHTCPRYARVPSLDGRPKRGDQASQDEFVNLRELSREILSRKTPGSGPGKSFGSRSGCKEVF